MTVLIVILFIVLQFLMKIKKIPDVIKKNQKKKIWHANNFTDSCE